MLYATTRNEHDVHTAYRTIHRDCGNDGGLYMPFSLPRLDMQQIAELKDRAFGDNVAQILNLFFSAGLTGWDVDFAIGRNAAQNVAINNRLLVCECWHNSHWRYDHMVQALSDRLRKEHPGEAPTNWVRVAVSTAVLFGIYGNLLAKEQVNPQIPLDLAVAVGDFSMPIAAWYAREMGLPLGNIICGCNANGSVWELLHRGQVNTGVSAIKTCTPGCDHVLPRDLERLIVGTVGSSELRRYLQCCESGSLFLANELTFEQLRQGWFASVNSDSRIISLISNFYRTNHYVLSPYAALAYGSLTDYRAKTGESRTALVLSECSPVRDDDFVASAMDISVPELEKILNLA